MLSKKEFWQWFKKEVEVRWKKHCFEWTEVGDWYWRLEKFNSDTLTQAVRQHKACECYPVPNLKKVYDYATAIESRNRPKRQRTEGQCNGIPDEHTFIMCVAKSDNGGGCVGWFVPILLWPFKSEWTPDDYRRVAEEQCVIHSRNGRNGVWKPFYNTTHSEMVQRRMALRNTQPLEANAPPQAG